MHVATRSRSGTASLKAGSPNFQKPTRTCLIHAAFTAKLFADQRPGESMKSDTSHPHAIAISVPITRSLERLLHRAALDRSQTVEELTKRILCDWLLKEGGVPLGSRPVKKMGSC
ncbi:MAG TPA: hypothetical protein VHG30_14290 [Microvirga sp.]|nr:hypothetical protein [Microvirga sp.]